MKKLRDNPETVVSSSASVSACVCVSERPACGIISSVHAVSIVNRQHGRPTSHVARYLCWGCDLGNLRLSVALDNLKALCVCES